jgi:hypothetical protein
MVPLSVISLDFENTLRHVVCLVTDQIILSIIITYGWHLHQLDITNAFLHDHIFKEVCMDQPPSYIDP